MPKSNISTFFNDANALTTGKLHCPSQYLRENVVALFLSPLAAAILSPVSLVISAYSTFKAAIDLLKGDVDEAKIDISYAINCLQGSITFLATAITMPFVALVGLISRPIANLFGIESNAKLSNGADYEASEDSYESSVSNMQTCSVYTQTD